jgi:hypothetical protein
MQTKNPSRGCARRGVALGLLLSLPGCYERLWVPPSELPHLSGYDIHNERQIHTVGPRSSYSFIETDRPYRLVATDGRPIDFNSQTPVYLHLRDGQIVGGHYLSVEVDEREFRGQTLSESLRVPLVDVAAVEAKRPSPGRTTALVVGLGLGVAALAAGLAAGVVVSSQRAEPHPVAVSP